MRLADLEPRWIGAGGEGVTRNGVPVPERHGIGISFNCPCGCAMRVAVPFGNPLDGQAPDDGFLNQWARTGDTFETLTLTPSILRSHLGICGWHGFVTNGEIVTV